MGYFDPQVQYVFGLDGSYSDKCVYTIDDAATGKRLATAETPEKKPIPGYSYYFVLYFGGEEVTTEPVTVSYAKH